MHFATCLFVPAHRCRLPHRRNGGEKCRLRLASPPEAGERDSVGEVPAGELGGGGFVVAVVQEAEQGGAEEIAGAEVVDEVDEGGLLVGGQGDGDGVGDGLAGAREVSPGEGFGGGAGDGRGCLGDGDAGVVACGAVADGPGAGGVAVGGGRKAFEGDDEGFDHEGEDVGRGCGCRGRAGDWRGGVRGGGVGHCLALLRHPAKVP